MKETKKFFDKNRLNKGYSKPHNTRRSDIDLMGRKYNHALPPVDMVEKYEELYPGTFDKLFDMSKKEQEHRHKMDLASIESYSKAMKSGRIFTVLLFVIICLTTIYLASTSGYMLASIFSALAFSCIALISCLCSKICIKSSSNNASYTRIARNRNYHEGNKKARRKN